MLSSVGMITDRMAREMNAVPIRYGLHSAGIGKLAESIGNVPSPPANAARATDRFVAMRAMLILFRVILLVVMFDFVERADHFADG